MQQILRLLQLNLFEIRELIPMLLGIPIKVKLPNPNQMTVF